MSIFEVKKMVYAIATLTLSFRFFSFFFLHFLLSDIYSDALCDKRMENENVDVQNEKKSFRWQKVKTSHLGQRQSYYEHSPTKIGKKVTRNFENSHHLHKIHYTQLLPTNTTNTTDIDSVGRPVILCIVQRCGQ